MAGTAASAATLLTCVLQLLEHPRAHLELCTAMARVESLWQNIRAFLAKCGSCAQARQDTGRRLILPLLECQKTCPDRLHKGVMQ